MAEFTVPTIPFGELFARAEYDRESQRVVALETAEGRVVPTHNPRVLGNETEWVEVEIVYPDDYDPHFHGLLRRESLMFSYDPDINKVVIEFPDADFSPPAIRGVLMESVNGVAQNELARTDWYVIREMETGKPVPPEVSKARQDVRAKAAAYQQRISTLPDSELGNFSVSFGEQPGDRPTPPEPTVRGADGREWRTDATSPDEKGNPVEPVEEME